MSVLLNQGVDKPATSMQEAAQKILDMATPDQEEVIEESAEAVTEETTEEAVEETEETEELDASDDGDDGEEVTEEPDSTDLIELNEWLAGSADQFDRLMVKTKFNGVEKETSLADLVKTYQIAENVEHRADSLKAEREQFKSEKDMALTSVHQELNQARGLVEALEQSFLSDFNKVNWDDLRDADPAEYSAKRQELQDRQQGIQQIKNHINVTQQQKFMESYREKISEQMAALPQVIPEWSNQDVMSKEKQDIRKYLLSIGLTAREIDGEMDKNGVVVSPGIIDARAIAIARKAMLYDQGMQKVDVIKKKVKKVPKVARPGKPESRAETDRKARSTKRGKLKKSGSLNDAASLIYDSMFGG